MIKQLAIALFCFIPSVAFSQPKSQPDVSELYRQIDSLEFSLFRIKDSVKRSASLTRLKNDQFKKSLDLYRALGRLENNRLNAGDSMLLNIEVTTMDSGGIKKTVTVIDADAGTVQSLVGNNGSPDSLFTDFPKLQQQYFEERLFVNSVAKHMKFDSPAMDLPALPKMPAATTVQTKKILADRILQWITNACSVCGCQNEVSSMLEDEKKINMPLDKIIANRRLFIDLVITPLYKNKQ